MHASPSSATGTSSEALAADLGIVMGHLLRSSNKDFFSALEDSGITFTQVKALHVLADADEPLAVSALSETIGLSAAAISRAVDGLVQRGEVKRAEDPRDRRSKLLTISARGRRTFERLAALRLAGLKRFVDDLSDAEREALAAGVGAIARRLHS